MERMVNKFRRIITKYWRVWWITAALSLQSTLENRAAAGFFISGKLLRFILFLGFLALLNQEVPVIAGVESSQLVIYFLIFNLIDLIGQSLFRGIYFFRHQVVSGELDFRLTKPMNVLFQIMTRFTDILDLPLIIIVVVMLASQSYSLDFFQIIILAYALVLSFILLTCVHVFIAAIGIITTEVDHTIMIFRDVSLVARFPISLYPNFIRLIFTFIIPIAVIFTLPASILTGQESNLLLVGTVICIIAIFTSRSFWHYAISKYSSASS
jgi:ABC-2 type transport system permease protein